MRDSTAIGDEVKKSLSAAGFSVKAAAEKAHLSYRTVLRYIKGERDMPVSVLLALMNAANADLVALAERLQPSLASNDSPAPALGRGVLGSTQGPLASEARDQFDSEMRALGIKRVELHALGAVEAAELRGTAAVVAEIVTELRNQQK